MHQHSAILENIRWMQTIINNNVFLLYIMNDIYYYAA